jgi:4-hydroxy-3-polyprenylbenzoate decarboxylase
VTEKRRRGGERQAPPAALAPPPLAAAPAPHPPRLIVGVSGASGAAFAVDLVKRAPGEKYLVVSDWGRAVLKMELGIAPRALAPHVARIFSDKDLAAPFSSGSNPFDAFVVIPCSLSTLGKVNAGIADTLITRVAQVALKERRRLVLAIRETPLPTNALEAAARLSREGVVIMPVAPPWYAKPRTLDDAVAGFVDKVLGVLGVAPPGGWRAETL